MNQGWASPSGGPAQGDPQRPEPRYGQYAPASPPPAAPAGRPPAAPGGPAAGPPTGYAPYLPMAHKPGVIALRPLTMGDIFEGSFATIRGNPVATIGMALLVGVICLAPAALIVWAVSQIPTDSSTGAEATWQLANIGSELILMLGGIVLTGMLTAVLGEAILGRRMTPGEAWRAARPRIGSLVVLTLILVLSAAVLGAVVVVAGILLILAAHDVGVLITVLLAIGLVLAFVYLWTRFGLAAPALVLERIGPLQALKRSWRLSSGQFWRLFGISLLATIAASLVAAIVIVPLSALLFGTSATLVDSADSAPGLGILFGTMCVSVLAGSLVRPFLAGVTGLLYIDQRIRREALDVNLMRTANNQQPQ